MVAVLFLMKSLCVYSSQAMEPDNTEEVPRPQEGVVVDLTNDSAVEDNDVIDLTTPKRIRVRSAGECGTRSMIIIIAQ